MKSSHPSKCDQRCQRNRQGQCSSHAGHAAQHTGMSGQPRAMPNVAQCEAALLPKPRDIRLANVGPEDIIISESASKAAIVSSNTQATNAKDGVLYLHRDELNKQKGVTSTAPMARNINMPIIPPSRPVSSKCLAISSPVAPTNHLSFYPSFEGLTSTDFSGNKENDVPKEVDDLNVRMSEIVGEREMGLLTSQGSLESVRRFATSPNLKNQKKKLRFQHGLMDPKSLTTHQPNRPHRRTTSMPRSKFGNGSSDTLLWRLPSFSMSPSAGEFLGPQSTGTTPTGAADRSKILTKSSSTGNASNLLMSVFRRESCEETPVAKLLPRQHTAHFGFSPVSLRSHQRQGNAF
eukprot:Selendium_serpulae@DN4845_c0_g1_i1.p1